MGVTELFKASSCKIDNIHPKLACSYIWFPIYEPYRQKQQLYYATFSINKIYTSNICIDFTSYIFTTNLPFLNFHISNETFVKHDQSHIINKRKLHLKRTCYADGSPYTYLDLPHLQSDSSPSQDNNRQI